MDLNQVNQVSQIAVDRIIADLSGRRGIGQEWEQIDDEIQAEIRNRWNGFFLEVWVEQTNALKADLSDPAIDMESLRTLVERSRLAFEKATDLQGLHDALALAVGKDGELTGVLRTLGQISADKRRLLGQIVNMTRRGILQYYEERLSALTPSAPLV